MEHVGMVSTKIELPSSDVIAAEVFSFCYLVVSSRLDGMAI